MISWGCLIVATLAGLALAGPVAAQSFDPGPPGPWVIDARGLISGLPDGRHRLQPAGDEAAVPGRGLGVDLGGHVYPLSWGLARVGFGAAVVWARGNASPSRLGGGDETPDPSVSPTVTTRMRVLAPQVSLNFGTGDGWSYISAGADVAPVDETLEGGSPGAPAATTWRGALNYGGGARWFLGPHLAFGFDVRIHQLMAREAETGLGVLPRTALTALNVGVSIR